MGKGRVMKEFFLKHKEIIMYLIVGVIPTVFSWVTYALFVRGVPVSAANVLSWVVTVLFAYVTNKVLVFESRSWEWQLVVREAVSFFGSRAATGVFEILAFPAFYYIGLNQPMLGVDGLPAKILTSVIVMVLNYICSKLFVFRGTQKKE